MNSASDDRLGARKKGEAFLNLGSLEGMVMLKVRGSSGVANMDLGIIAYNGANGANRDEPIR